MSTATITEARCYRCGHTTTEPTDLELWNGYGDCPGADLRCLAHDTRWTLSDGTTTAVIDGDGKHYRIDIPADLVVDVDFQVACYLDDMPDATSAELAEAIANYLAAQP